MNNTMFFVLLQCRRSRAGHLACVSVSQHSTCCVLRHRSSPAVRVALDPCWRCCAAAQRPPAAAPLLRRRWRARRWQRRGCCYAVVSRAATISCPPEYIPQDCTGWRGRRWLCGSQRVRRRAAVSGGDTCRRSSSRIPSRSRSNVVEGQAARITVHWIQNPFQK